MPQDDKTAPSIDYRGVILLITVVAGGWFVAPSLRSSRPPTPETLSQGALGDQVVPSQLWEDPFEVAQDFIKGLTNQPLMNQGTSDFTLNEVAHQIIRHRRRHEPQAPVVVLEVMVPGGSYAEDSEQRHRTRYATVSALRVAGYQAWDAEHMGYAEVPWIRGADLETVPLESIPQVNPKSKEVATSLPLPFEWYVPDFIATRQRSNDVLVLWLKSDAFVDIPARRLAQVNSFLMNASATDKDGRNDRGRWLQFKLINPSLLEVLGENFRTNTASDPKQSAKKSLGEMEVFSSWSTTADELLTSESVGGRRRERVAQDFKARWGASFHNATCTDDELAEELIDELALRGVNLRDDNQGVVLLSDSDTAYGRALPLTFAAVRRFRSNDLFNSESFPNILQFKGFLQISNSAHPYVWSGLSSRTRQAIESTNSDSTTTAASLASDFNEIIEGGARSAIHLSNAVPSSKARALFESAGSLSNLSDGKLIHLNRRLLEIEFPGFISPNRLKDAFEVLKTDAVQWPSNIFCINYLRGIDGLSPEDAGPDPKSDADGHKAKSDSAPRPEGHAQLDYLSRLADRLAEIKSRREDRSFEFKAVGVLGSDVYDKLLVLQALKRVLPDQLVFTTDLDARLVHPEALKWTRNVIVASSFGLRLRNEFQRQTFPFRDTYQTGLYLACLAALDYPGASNCLSTITPRRFEIGRNGAYDLSVKDNPADPRGAQPSLSSALRKYWSLPAVIALAFLISIRRRDAKVRIFCVDVWKGRIQNPPVKSWWLGLSRLVLFGPAILLLLVGIVVWICHTRRDVEPFSLLDGISIWPTELIRLFTGCLASFLLLLAQRDQETNKSMLETDYGLDRRKGFGRTAQSKVDIYQNYDVSGHVVNRGKRVGTLVAWYGAMTGLLLWNLDFLFVPYRGGGCKYADKAALLYSASLLIVLIFYVSDACNECRKFIKNINDAKVCEWPDLVCAKLPKLAAMAPLLHSSRYPYEYIDVKIVATRTGAIAKLIFYPFTVLFLMLVARASFFDHWTWPPHLIVFFALNSVYAFYIAWALRNQAEELRTEALDKMETRMLLASNRLYRERMKALMEDIKSCDQGAFAPLMQQPFIQATLAPLMAIAGILADSVASKQ